MEAPDRLKPRSTPLVGKALAPIKTDEDDELYDDKARIMGAFLNMIESIIEVGQELRKAHDVLSPDDWDKLFEDRRPCSKQVAEMLMEVQEREQAFGMFGLH
jgi:hypothetical protein